MPKLQSFHGTANFRQTKKNKQRIPTWVSTFLCNFVMSFSTQFCNNYHHIQTSH